jgi:hypothetical protein
MKKLTDPVPEVFSMVREPGMSDAVTGKSRIFASFRGIHDFFLKTDVIF